MDCQGLSRIGEGTHMGIVWLFECQSLSEGHSEGDQPWDFFGRNDAKAETLVLWPPHAKN